MRHLSLAGWMSFFVCLMIPAAALAEENPEGTGKGLKIETQTVQGVTNGLESFADKTITEVTDTVETISHEAVENTSNTEAVTHVKEAVKTISQPNKEAGATLADETTKLVNKVNQNTGKTVEKAITESLEVVNKTTGNTTEIVRDTVSEKTKTLKDAPVVKEVQKGTNQLIQSITETADEVAEKTKSSSVHPGAKKSKPSVSYVENDSDFETDENENRSNNQPPVAEQKESAEDSTASKANQPMLESLEADMVQTVLYSIATDSYENEETNLPVEQGSIDLSLINKQSGVGKTVFPNPTKKGIPLQTSEVIHVTPIIVNSSGLGGTSKTNSSPTALTGNDHIFAAIITDQEMQSQANRVWDRDGYLLATQWSNAPPGQPPSYAPFLYEQYKL